MMKSVPLALSLFLSAAASLSAANVIDLHPIP